ncbi:MAG TPA: hypothetical protein VI977_05710 [archaeon]|nr:hypothetical protein [archaeon]
MAVKGIVIRPEFFDSKNLEMHTGRAEELFQQIRGQKPSRDFYINFSLSIGFFQKGINRLSDGPRDCNLFVSNRGIQRTIEVLPEKTDVGYIKVWIDPTGKEIRTVGFFPISTPQNLKLLGKGITSFAELQIERQLEKWFPDFKITHSSNPTPERKRQLRKRGREIGEKVPLRKAIALTSTYVKKGIRQYNARSALRRRSRR